MKCKMKILIILVLISVIFISLSLNWLFATKNQETIVKDYTIQNYVLTNKNKEMLIERLGGYDIFAKYENTIESYANISVSTDKKDGKAWGKIILFFNMDDEEELKKILQLSGINKSNDTRLYAVYDDDGSIYIEKDYVNEDRIKLTFAFYLPYRYTEEKNYNKYINFFLKLSKNK